MDHHHGPPEGTPLCTLFVYGTLRSGQPNSPRLGGATLVGVGQSKGRLAHLGKYPGMTDGPGLVRGEVYELPVAALARIDDLEGYDQADPDGSLFLRVRREVTLDGGSSLECWTYHWPHPCDQWIDSGDWIEFLTRTRAGQPPVPWL